MKASPSIGSASGASMQTGTSNATGTVTDSRGRTVSKNATINVYPYAAPSFTPLDIFRCASNGIRNDTDRTHVYLKCMFGRSSLLAPTM